MCLSLKTNVSVCHQIRVLLAATTLDRYPAAHRYFVGGEIRV